MSELSSGWTNATIADLIAVDGLFSDGDWVESKDQDPSGSIRLLQLADIGDGKFLNKSNRFVNEIKFVDLRCTEVLAGDVLVARMPDPLGRACLMPQMQQRCITVVDVAILRPGCDSVVPTWLMHMINAPEVRGTIELLSSGTTRRRISRNNLSQIELPIPPFNEQKRISDKLDQLLAAVDSCKTRLDTIPGIIKRFRQSVLTAASSGELMAGVNGFSRDSLIQEVFENIADVIDTHPSHRTPAEVEGGVPYIGIGDVDALGQIDFTRSKKVDWAVFSEHQQRYRIEEGDFIFGKIGTLGKPTKLPIGIKYTISPNVLLIKPKRKSVNPDFLCILMGSPAFLNEVAGASVATSQAAFGIKKMRKLQVTIPSIEKQLEIVRRVEALFVVADRLEARYQAACAQVNQLTPSLLAKAFRSGLVPQEPNDEPASVLLARIKSSQTENKNIRTKTIQNKKSTPLENKSKHGEIMLQRKNIQPSHLSSILKARGPLTAEKLWSASQLDIDDFYDQLKDEDKLGLLKERTDSSSDDSRLLEAS